MFPLLIRFDGLPVAVWLPQQRRNDDDPYRADTDPVDSPPAELLLHLRHAA
jgi:hypothetical protein